VFDVTSDEGVVSTQYQLDGSAHWITSPGTLTELRVSNEGVHKVQVKVCTLACTQAISHLYVFFQGVDQAGNVSPRPCAFMSWTVDTIAPELSVITPANNTVTQNSTMTVMVNASEPLSRLLVLQPGFAKWTKANATTSEFMLTAYGEGQQQAALKGGF
jgi:hypothetical protein